MTGKPFQKTIRFAQDLYQIYKGSVRGQGRRETASLLNDYFDEILSFARDRIENSFPLPDLNEDFESGRGLLSVKGTLRTRRGRFGNISTLMRTGDVSVETLRRRSVGEDDPTGLRLRGQVGLAEAFLEVEEYKLKLWRLGTVNGKVRLRIGRNSAGVSILLGPDPKRGGAFGAVLEEAKIHRLEDLRVQITGLGLLNNLTGWIARKMIESVKEELTLRLNGALEEALREVLKEIDLETLFKVVLGRTGGDLGSLVVALNALRGGIFLIPQGGSSPNKNAPR